MKNILIIFLSITLIFISCDSDDDTLTEPSSPVNNLDVEFNFLVNGEAIDYENQKRYAINDGDTLLIHDFKFILSNIRMISENNWIEEDSYRLVKLSDNNGDSFEVSGIDNGTYTGFEFIIGMDSTMNFKPEDFPILFQTDNMYWVWNTGYKFLVLEADYNSAPPGLTYHIGGANVVKKLRFEFDNSIQFNNNTHSLTFDIEIANIFKGPNSIDLSDPLNRQQMGGGVSSLIAANYAQDMISLISVE